MLQYEKMGYTLGYRNLNNIRNYIYDAVARVSQVSKAPVLTGNGNRSPVNSGRKLV